MKTNQIPPDLQHELSELRDRASVARRRGQIGYADLLTRAADAVVRITHGSQPIDYPGAWMVINLAREQQRTGSSDAGLED